VNTTLTTEGRPLPYVFSKSSAERRSASRETITVRATARAVRPTSPSHFVGSATSSAHQWRAHLTAESQRATGQSVLGNRVGHHATNKAVAFLQNHDTQHQCGISYRDGNVFRMANVWMLAQPYGYPSILSSYVFSCPSENSLGPPSDVNGWTTAVTCASSLETAGAANGSASITTLDLENGELPPCRRGHRREPLVGQRRQRDCLLARH